MSTTKQRRAAAKAVRAAQPSLPGVLTRERLIANNARVKGDEGPVSKRTIAINGRREALVGPGLGNHVQAASNSIHLPMVGNPTPSTMVSTNPRIRALVRYSYTNHNWFKSMIDRLGERVVGEGPTPDTRSPVLKALWAKASKHIDSRGRNSFAQWLLNDVYKPFLMDGESFVRKIPLPLTGFDRDGFPTFGDDASPIGFEMRSMTAEFVPEYYSEWGGEFGGKQTFTNYGVVLNAANLDKRLGYYVYDQHPFDTPGNIAGSYMAYKVPASEVAHLHVPPMPGAVRGEIRWQSILIRAMRLNDYEDAEIRRKQLNNALCFFITESADVAGDTFFPGEVDEDGVPLAGPDGEQAFDVETLKSQVDISPGGITKLAKGQDVKINNPAATPQTDDWWSRFQVIAMCSCAGIPDYEVTQDYSNVQSDRVMKTATQNSKAKYRLERGQVQHTNLNFVWNAFVTDAAMSGRFVPPEGESYEDYFDEPWDWPRIEDATTKQDVDAAIAMINAKIVDRDQVTRDLAGKDPEETARRVARVAARDADYGFNQEPVAVLKTGGSVVPFWSPSTPTAQSILADVTGEEGGQSMIPAMIPIPDMDDGTGDADS